MNNFFYLHMHHVSVVMFVVGDNSCAIYSGDDHYSCISLQHLGLSFSAQ